jgi:hypothetical protein
MTIDRPAIRLDFKGTVDGSDVMKAEFEALAKEWPDGAQVRHRRFGTKGVIRLDDPCNVPGTFDGQPSAWCIGHDGEVWLSVVWGAEATVPLRAWAPARSLRLTGWSA